MITVEEQITDIRDSLEDTLSAVETILDMTDGGSLANQIIVNRYEFIKLVRLARKMDPVETDYILRRLNLCEISTALID